MNLIDFQRLNLKHEDELSSYTETLITFDIFETDVIINTKILNTDFEVSAVIEDFVKELKKITYEKIKRRIRGEIDEESKIVT